MKNRGQAIIEFTLGTVCAIVFLILACNLFVWFNHCLVRRQRAYEQSREEAGRPPTTELHGNPGREDFYTPPRLNVFTSGGS